MNDRDHKIVKILKKNILRHGALSLADYMHICLTHPIHGYYIKNEPIGTKGDFTTSPEISQMFGELIGLWIVQVWMDHQKPEKFSLVELGPGKGTLMADILRATRMITDFHNSLELILIEISPSLKSIQKRTLKGFPAQWKTEIKALPNQPTIIIANEFFDALPINQFQRKSDKWMEVMVNLKGLSGSYSNEFCFELMNPSTASSEILINFENEVPEEGCMIEISKTMQNIVYCLSKHIHQNSGAALIIDYGKEGNVGNTLQAVHKHRYSNPLSSPGQQDLTSFVDFKAIRTYAEESGLIASHLTNQGDFLKNLGIEQRAEILSKGLSGNDLVLHQTALDRLINKNLMGDLFKVLGIRSAKSPPLIGLET
ncbi:MAG: methyltransferase [Rhodobacteraceae bacterium]|nr:MAG: methyltransferase [Paracoccaceae bacterium]